MKRSRGFVNWVLRGVFRTVCRIHRDDLDKVPMTGPLILVGNHVNFLETPVMIPHMGARPVTGIGKRESWKNPLFNFLFNVWEIIPIDRGTVDQEAFRLSYEALAAGKILVILPEGTRSYDGCLQQGKPGVVALAVRSKAPLLPIVVYGHENFWHNFKRLRRTDFYIRVGKPFRLNTGGAALSRDARQEVTDEIMRKLAELLPERYRGYYQDAGQKEYRYLADL